MNSTSRNTLCNLCDSFCLNILNLKREIWQFRDPGLHCSKSMHTTKTLCTINYFNCSIFLVSYLIRFII